MCNGIGSRRRSHPSVRGGATLAVTFTGGEPNVAEGETRSGPAPAEARLDSDTHLLERWRRGDREAGSALFEAHFESVHRFFRNRVAGDIEDLIQQTFLAALEARTRFRGKAKFRTYLLQIARYQLYAFYRRRRAVQAPDCTFSNDSCHDTSPSGGLSSCEHQRQLLAALWALPLDLQLALELTYVEGLGAQQVAAVLQIPPGTVASRLRRAKERLRSALCDSEPHGAVGALADSIDAWAQAVQEHLRSSRATRSTAAARAS